MEISALISVSGGELTVLILGNGYKEDKKEKEGKEGKEEIRQIWSPICCDQM